MKIAVTGGSGELGRSLSPYLLQEGHQVVSIDRFLTDTAPLSSPDSPDYRVADVTNFGEVVSSLDGCDAVIHLAAHRSPVNHPDLTVYNENTSSSFNILYAAGLLGIERVCLASSVNAIGGAFSRTPRYDYFPIDENHPTYAEDPYSLSKWVLEQQGDAFVRRYEKMKIASLRFHWLTESREIVAGLTRKYFDTAVRHLWAYTLLSEANRACLLSLTEDFEGHEVFYITAPNTALDTPSIELSQTYYPDVPLRSEMPGNSSFFNSGKAGRILGWYHSES